MTETASQRAPQPPRGVKGCRLMEIRSHSDERGGLAFVEGKDEGLGPAGLADLPFAIRRIYYLWGMSSDTVRGAHAHRDLQQLYIAIHGSFDVILEDEGEQKRLRLDRPDQGLYLGQMVWRRLENFSPGAVCLVLASAPYDENDYFRDKAAFLRAATQR